MPAVTLSGSFQKVTLGVTSKILGAGKYSISGATRKTVDVSEFGVDIDIFEFASADGGTINLSDVAYDPTDPNQNTLQAAVTAGTKLNGSTTSAFCSGSIRPLISMLELRGNILMTSAGKVDADRSGVAKDQL